MITIHFLQAESLSNLILNFVVLENVRKGDRKIYTSMGVRHLHNVKKEADRDALFLKMYSNRHVSLVVWRSPGIRSKVQCASVFLYRMF